MGSRAWQPPCDLPDTPQLADRPDLRNLLETFWTSRPIWPSSVATAAEPDTTSPLQSEAGPSSGLCGKNTAANWTDDQLLSLHSLLATLDPNEAQRWHWRDGRKVKRSIERWWEAQAEAGDPEVSDGNAAGEVTSEVNGKAGRKARFRTLVFWVYEDMDFLKPRLDGRVDRMVQVCRIPLMGLQDMLIA